MELPENAPILQAMTRPASLAQIKQFLQNEDETVKTNCFRLLHHLLCRVFDTTTANDWTSARSFGYSSSNKDTNAKNDEQELQDAKINIKEEFYTFLSDVVQSVVAFEFSASSGVSTTDKELNFAQILGD